MSGDHHSVQAQHSAAHALLPLSLCLSQMTGALEWEDVPTEFRYDPDHPLLVTIRFAPEGAPPVTWHVGRDLLHEGLRTTSGLGDVQVWADAPADRETAWLQINAHGGIAIFSLPVPELGEWLDRTYLHVPAGTESSRLGTDAFLSKLFDEPEASSR
ncbi:SsgA family sporulation/cell division regulator [Streptomyces tendae]|uniref:SsgA family sporulation/cell division regulator n=2 Tax=Streptomyces tendae TaxID=1932 RepID=A0A6B3QXJ4_STRTE|nr:SsgA family sporulation/cell division regulator [Streptomyces sp. RK74B]MBQ1005826.1 SsgA family sporulation/cell division regulator [Streptomyces sp. RK23]MZG13047.1 SsgA family sporulation/cell division regulator [Streptomyces sp. SID5914]NEV91930.1 SsgA family sporulation/cell division regulator [Streptomyces tendae]BET52131.1 SsgA family sporulation/cell division regulator [Kitasatospora aureofaciens]